MRHSPPPLPPVPPKCPSRGPPAASPTRCHARPGPGPGRVGTPPPRCPPPGALRSERADDRSTSSVARNVYDNQRPSLAGHIVALANDVPRPDAAVAPPRSRIPNAGERRRVAAASLASLARDIGRTGVGDPRFAIRARSCRASLDASVVGGVRPPRRPGGSATTPDPTPIRASSLASPGRIRARPIRSPTILALTARVNATMMSPSSRPSRRLDPSRRPPDRRAGPPRRWKNPRRRGGHPSRPEGGRDSRRRRDATTRPARAR